MEGIWIVTIRKGTFREGSITTALIHKESALSPATYINGLSQIKCNFNVNTILGDSNIDDFNPESHYWR